MILEIHARLGNAAMYYAAILALWGLWRIFRKQEVDRSYWGALIIAEVMLLLQGGLGIYLYFFRGLRLARQVHVLYGALSALVIPTALAYTRGRQKRAEMIVYGVSILVLVVLTIRALGTAGMLLVFE